MVIIRLKEIWVRVIYALTYILLIVSVITKLFCIPYIHEKFLVLGINEFCRLFGAIELIAVIIFLYTRTIGLGFVLLCCYFGGAIATDINAPVYLYQPIVILLLIFATAFLRKPSIFYDGLFIGSKDNYSLIEYNQGKDQ